MKKKRKIYIYSDAPIYKYILDVYVYKTMKDLKEIFQIVNCEKIISFFLFVLSFYNFKHHYNEHIFIMRTIKHNSRMVMRIK